MSRPIATRTHLMMLMAMMTLLSACATTQPPQPVAKDDADRLFLKLVDIARAPTSATIHDLLDVSELVHRIPTSGDDCMSKNTLLLNATETALNNDLADDNPANWARESADMRQSLRRLQAMPLQTGGCAGRAFPQVKI